MRRPHCASALVSCWERARDACYRARFKGLSHDEVLVFQLIQASGNMGAASPASAVGFTCAVLTSAAPRLQAYGRRTLRSAATCSSPRRALFEPCSAVLCSRVPQINKCLKSLEQRKLIKAVKSVASSNRKVYMLFELEPSREITGGAWCVYVAPTKPWLWLTRPPRPGTLATSMTASSSTCCGKSATSSSSARSAPRLVRSMLACSFAALHRVCSLRPF